jgi:perosamine synthetase
MVSSGEIIRAIRVATDRKSEPLGLHEPSFNGNEWAYVKECLDTTMVSSVGEFVDRLETDLASYCGVAHAVATVNGTTALHLCLELVGVSEGDEVFIPTLTFVATANAVRYCGAIPHLVDSEFRTLGLDPAKLAAHLDETAELREDGCYNRRSGRRIRAVVPMHAFGHPVDLDPLIEICERFGLALVEDAAQGLGSTYKGRHVGTLGGAGIFSFNGNKIITTGGGGALVTGDASLAEAAKHLSTTAKRCHPWEHAHDRVGFNYRMPNLNAAVGCAQLEQLADFVNRKRALAARYREAFASVEGVEAFGEPVFARSNYWLCTVLLESADPGQRDDVLRATAEVGIQTRPCWSLLHRLPMYADCPRMDLAVAEELDARIICLPSSAEFAPS